LREHLQWEGIDFVEHDVEGDPAARERMLALTGGQRAVPVWVEDDRVKQVGWQGRSCFV
jgi:glutaredoxin